MNLVLIGRGRMGSMLWELAEAAGHTALARVDVDDLDTLAALPRGDVALEFFPAPAPWSRQPPMCVAPGRPIFPV